MRVKDFVSIVRNKKNNQERLEIKKLKLKRCDIDIDELLNAKISSRHRNRGLFDG